MRKLTKKEIYNIFGGGFFENLGYIFGRGTKSRINYCTQPENVSKRVCLYP